MIIGRELLRCILESGEVHPLLDARLDQEWLSASDSGASMVFSGEERQAYEWILTHWYRHRKVPDLSLFRQNWPEDTLPFYPTSSTLAELIEEATNIAQLAILKTGINDVVKLLGQGDVPEAAEQFQSTAHRLGSAFSQEGVAIAVIGNPDKDIKKMLNEKVLPGPGIGSYPVIESEECSDSSCLIKDYHQHDRFQHWKGPLKELDESFYGMQPGQLITLLGRQKSGKTTFMAHSAYQAWLGGYNTLFFSVEMDAEILMQRVLSIAAGVNPEDFRRGTLKPSHKEKVLAAHKRFQDNIEEIPFRISKKRTLITMDDIIMETQQYRPHIVYIDGFYFMKDRVTGKTAGPDWQAHDNLAAELKTFAGAERIPIFVSTQVQEKQYDKAKRIIEGSSMMGGTGLLRFSDLVIGQDKDAEDVITINEVVSRYNHVPTTKFKINWADMGFNLWKEGS